jgi:hypothetical protein
MQVFKSRSSHVAVTLRVLRGLLTIFAFASTFPVIIATRKAGENGRVLVVLSVRVATAFAVLRASTVFSRVFIKLVFDEAKNRDFVFTAGRIGETVIVDGIFTTAGAFQTPYSSAKKEIWQFRNKIRNKYRNQFPEQRDCSLNSIYQRQFDFYPKQ